MTPLFGKPKAIGMVLDLSLQANARGEKLSEKVRKELIRFVTMLEDDDLFYLYHPDKVILYEQRGEQVAALGNHRLDGSKLNLRHALKQTLYVLGAELVGADRFLIFITDRIKQSEIGEIEKIMKLNSQYDYGCQCIIVTLGSEQKALATLCDDDPQSSYVCLADPTTLHSILLHCLESID
jgi:hypothetical protein